MIPGACSRYVCHLLVVVFLSAAAPAAQADWLQWGGPKRDFKMPATGLAASWPEKGPTQLWTRELGDGYSAIAVQGAHLFTMYRKDDREVVVSLDAATGKTLWEHAYDAPLPTDDERGDHAEYYLDQGPGPRAMPTIADGRVFTLGATGKLHALDTNTGKVVWQRDLRTELPAQLKKRGYTANPLVYKNLLIMPVGSPGAAIVAFNQADGAIVWKRHDFGLAYSSPTLIDVDGQLQVVAFMKDEIVGVLPENGDLVWTHPANSSNGTHVTMPIFGDGNLLFYTAAYGLGGRVLKLTRTDKTTTVKELWHNAKVRVHFANTIRIGDVIYMTTGDFGPAFLTAVDVNTGNLLWQRRSVRASLLFVDGRFLIMDEDGKLVLASLTPDGPTFHSEVQLLKHNAWTLPTLEGKTLYLRDRKTIMALSLP